MRSISYLLLVTIIHFNGSQDSRVEINDPYLGQCRDKSCCEGAACVPDDFSPREFHCQCIGGWVGDGITSCEPPPVYLVVSPDMPCNQTHPNTCFLESEIGQSVRLHVQAHGALTDVRWRIEWYRFYSGLLPVFHSFREILDSPAFNYSDEQSNREVNTITSLGEDSFYPNRYIAEIHVVDDYGNGYSQQASARDGDPIAVFDLTQTEWRSPSITRVYFVIESIPVEIAPHFTGNVAMLDLNRYISSDQSGPLHFRWASEGAIDILGRQDHTLLEEHDSKLNLNRLREEQLDGAIRGMAYGRNGRVPGRVLVASCRFKIQEGKNQVCSGPFAARVCKCRSGYVQDGTGCIDINECLLTSTMCAPEAVCVNTEGSFRCECSRGFAGDGITACADVDECAVENPCHPSGLCINSHGSFSCSCADGYIGDGFDCTAISEWTLWSSWSACRQSCGDSERIRSRECTHPESGMICYGPSSQAESCRGNPPCPVDGGWSAWSPWTHCTSTCDGRRERVRVCDHPTPTFGGRFCEGDMYIVAVCGDLTCPGPGVWAAWEEWSECSLACNGTQSRWRQCDPLRLGAAEGLCEGEEKQSRACFLVRNPEMCNQEPTWGLWTHWSYCSQTCGEGRRYRRRSCVTQPGSHSLTCRGQNREAQPCIERACDSAKGRRLYPSY
ncbi:uncharacterized protein [Diadema setosum]|uniref:uncharacterized protein n=1 Tax=Diadema setosum TaxID=31175 RepID=UPI003B3B7F58